MKHDEFYMSVAQAASMNSFAKRKKVGACIVTRNQVLLSGWNGTPSGLDNDCEYTVPEEYDYDSRTWTPEQVLTRREVIHAEINALAKAAREGVSTLGSTLYCTLSPCVECAKVLIQAGVSEVIYEEDYRDQAGKELLKKCGVLVLQIKSKHQGENN